VSGSDEGERWNDHLTGRANSSQHNLQAKGRIAYGDDVLDTKALGNAFLELANKRTPVRKPPSVEHRLDSLEELRTRPDIRSTHVKWLVELRRSTEDGKMFSTHRARAEDGPTERRRGTKRARSVVSISPRRSALTANVADGWGRLTGTSLTKILLGDRASEAGAPYSATTG
jgi:hypothetical protein